MIAKIETVITGIEYRVEMETDALAHRVVWMPRPMVWRCECGVDECRHVVVVVDRLASEVMDPVA